MVVIAQTIIEVTADFKEVLTQLKAQANANLEFNRTSEEKIQVTVNLTREQTAVIHFYYKYIVEQRQRIEQLGYSWPTLTDLQPGPPPMHH
jgi:phenylalanyl-tRNA synthetase alpha subunit